MKDEVQAPQEETPNTYWRWLVESWRYPLGHNLGEKWYGVVTLLGEDIVLFIGLAITSNYIANMFDITLIHHASGFTFWAIVILFCVQIITILCSMVGYLFVFGSIGGFWQYVNKVAQVTNWNFCIVICAFFFLILSLSSGLLGFGEALVWIFYALFSLGSFLLVVCPDPGTEKMIYDPFWGAIIYLVMIVVIYAIIWGLAFSIMSNLQKY